MNWQGAGDVAVEKTWLSSKEMMQSIRLTIKSMLAPTRLEHEKRFSMKYLET